jgi:integrase
VASVIKLNGKWRALIRKKGHKPISKWFDRKIDADAWARDIEDQISKGVQKPQKGFTVGKMIQAYRKLRDHSRPILDTSTEHYTLKRIEELLGDKSVYLTVDELLDFAVARKKEGAGPYTINCDISKLGTVFRYAGNGAPDVVAIARPKLKYLSLIGDGKRRERRPEQSELEDILDALEQPYKDAVLFAVLTAMRLGEICRIQRVDLNSEKRTVLIRDRKHPRNKAGNNEEVPLLGPAWDIATRQPDGELIFPIYPGTLSKKFTKVCSDLGIPDLHFHDLRHEGVSRLFEQGFTIEQVALVSGHKDWRHLRRYTNLKPESLHSLSPQGTRPKP